MATYRLYTKHSYKNDEWKEVPGSFGYAGNSEIGAQLINSGISLGMCAGIEDFAIKEIESGEFVFIWSLDKDQCPINDLMDTRHYKMPEISNIKEAAEEFFDYANSLGVGGLL